MKKLFVILLIIVLVSGLGFGAGANPAPEKAIELSFAHFNPPTAWTSVKFLNPWAKKVEEATNGKVKITMYPGQSLCKAKEVLEATAGGVCDIGWLCMGFYPGRFPLSSVISLPFLNLSTAGKIDGRTLSPGAVNSRIFQELYETFPKIQAEFSGVKVLFLHSSEPFPLFTNKPVRNMADLKGMKIRSLTGPESEMWKLLGASPILIPIPGVYEAAERGVIDGVSISLSAFLGYRLYEVFDYWIDVGTCVTRFGVIMNLDKWNSLPPDIQKAIMSVSGMYGAEFAGESAWGFEVAEKTIAKVQEEGQTLEKISLEPGEFERWREIAGKPLWDKWVAQMEVKGLPGQKILDETLRLIEKYK